MGVTRRERPFTSEEARLFDRAVKVFQAKPVKTRWPWLIALSLLSVVGALDLWYFNPGNEHVWAICSVCYVPILVWIAIEDHFKRGKVERRLSTFVQKYERHRMVEVVEVRATRVARLREFEDESDLYLFELMEGGCLFLWDLDDKTIRGKSFPCSVFDVYVDEEFKNFIRRKVASGGEVLKVIDVAATTKWQWLKTYGPPEDMEQRDISFDMQLNEIGAVV